MIYITKEEIMDYKKHTYILCDYSSIDEEYMDTILNHRTKFDRVDCEGTHTFFRLNISEKYYVIEIDEIDEQDMVVM